MDGGKQMKKYRIQRMISLDDETDAIASRMSNFSAWVRDKVRKYGKTQDRPLRMAEIRRAVAIAISMSEKNEEFADVNSKFMDLSNPIWATMEKENELV